MNWKYGEENPLNVSVLGVVSPAPDDNISVTVFSPQSLELFGFPMVEKSEDGESFRLVQPPRDEPVEVALARTKKALEIQEQCGGVIPFARLHELIPGEKS